MSVHGEMGENAALWLADRAQPCSRIVEIGSLQGRSALAMLSNPNTHLWCVDVWEDESNYTKFLSNTEEYQDRLTVLRMPSHQGATLLLDRHGKGSFDMVFIDGGHDYETVKGDILGYRPLVREGGILCGHDYSGKYHPEVKRAVDELVDSPNRGAGCIWWVAV